MKTIFIPTELKLKVDEQKIKEVSKKLPKNIAIAYSVQYANYAGEIKKLLQSSHEITGFIQVLGCSKPKFPRNTKAVLLISDGRFHAVSLASETHIPIYIYNNKLIKISEEEIKELKKRQKASYVNFLNSASIGILVSTKPGQERLKRALKMKDKLKDKKSYLFISNIINTAEFENFPQIESWLNTACPRLDMESNKIINIDEMK